MFISVYIYICLYIKRVTLDWNPDSEGKVPFENSPAIWNVDTGIYNIIYIYIIWCLLPHSKAGGPHASIAEAAAGAVVQPHQGVAGPADLYPPPAPPPPPTPKSIHHISAYLSINGCDRRCDIKNGLWQLMLAISITYLDIREFHK